MSGAPSGEPSTFASNGLERDGEMWKLRHGQRTLPASLPFTSSVGSAITPPSTGASADCRDHHDITSSMTNFDHYAANVDVATMDRGELQGAVVHAYLRLTRKELILLLSLRTLPTYGNNEELAFRLAVHDLSHRTDLSTPRMHTPPPSNDIAFTESPSSYTLCNTPPIETQESYHSDITTSDVSQTHPNLTTLPPELWADIFEFVGDWELPFAFNIRSSLRVPWDCTYFDHVLMTGNIPFISSYLRRPSEKMTSHGAKALIKFGYVDVLKLLHKRRPQELQQVFGDDSMHIPVLASRFGKTKVLQWWLEASNPDNEYPMKRDYNDEPLDEASRKGYIHALQWWKDSGLPLKYGLVMDVASSSSQLPVLEWWKNSGLQLEYGRNALRAASYRGAVGVLEWWKRSGLRLIYDKEVLVEATKFNRVEVLEWWENSDLRVEYLLMEIEAALEDAIGGGKEAREWWRRRGARFDVSVRELMEYKVL